MKGARRGGNGGDGQVWWKREAVTCGASSKMSELRMRVVVEVVKLMVVGSGGDGGVK